MIPHFFGTPSVASCPKHQSSYLLPRSNSLPQQSQQLSHWGQYTSAGIVKCSAELGPWVTVTLSDATSDLIIIHRLKLSLHYLINYGKSLMTSCFRAASAIIYNFSSLNLCMFIIVHAKWWKTKEINKNSKMKFSSKCQLKGMNGGQLGDLKLINVCLNLFPDFSNCKRTSRPYLKLISCYSIHGKIYLLTNQKKRWLSSTEHP